jgi:endonuclease G
MNKQTTKLLILGFKAIRQQPKLIQLSFFWLPFVGGLALIIGGGLYFYETKVAQPKMAYMGVPISQNNWQNLTHTLRNEAYLAGYSEKFANPLWVTYKVHNNKQKYGKRPSFSSDWRSLAHISTNDYKHTGYDRGHLAPNYVIGSRYGRSAQKETFLMTNISPQKPKFNQKIWQRLEEVSANHFSKQFESFWVVTGPIFAKKPNKLKNTSVAIPSAFYKIFIAPKTETQSASALAFIMPQTAKPTDSLLKYVTSIDEIEKRTKLDFFWQLEDSLEAKLEKSTDHKPWNLQKYSNLPSRY